MKTEDKLRIKLQDPAVQARLRAIKKKWGLNQNSYNSVRNYIRDSRLCYKVGKTLNLDTKTCRRLKAGNYFAIRDGKKVRIDHQDQYDFMDEVAAITNNEGLPLRTADILIDYLVYEKINFKKPSIGIGIERNALKNELGRVLLYIDPDIRLADIKREWHKIRKIQNIIQRDGKKNRSPKNIEIVIKSKKAGKKYKTLDIIRDLNKKDEDYDRKISDPRASANARQMKYRYRKQK